MGGQRVRSGAAEGDKGRERRVASQYAPVRRRREGGRVGESESSDEAERERNEEAASAPTEPKRGNEERTEGGKLFGF